MRWFGTDWHPPVFKNFRATDFINAYILNALVISFMAVMVIVFDGVIADAETDMSKELRWFIAFLLSFGAGLLAYAVMYFFFGYGGGLLVNPSRN
jgi:hypothetical protein